MASSELAQLDLFLSKHGLKILFAESMTAGALCAQMALALHSGQYLLGSLVCYDRKMKEKWLGVDPALIDRCCAESIEVTNAMIEGLRLNENSDVYVSITGLAYTSNDPQQLREVGTVFYAFSFREKQFFKKSRFDGSAEAIIQQTAEQLWKDLLSWLEAELRD